MTPEVVDYRPMWDKLGYSAHMPTIISPRSWTVFHEGSVAVEDPAVVFTALSPMLRGWAPRSSLHVRG
jgi:hypothetical protein